MLKYLKALKRASAKAAAITLLSIGNICLIKSGSWFPPWARPIAVILTIIFVVIIYLFPPDYFKKNP